MTLQRSQPRHSVRPSLLLDFANGKTLDPRIDFTRASTAFFYDGETYAKAEENLFEYSQQFDDSYWAKLRSTVTANADTAPDGTTTADAVLQASGETTSGLVQRPSIPVVAGDYVISVFARPNGKNFLRIFEQLSDGTNNTTWFNVSTGAVGTTDAGHTASITASTNSYYRCSIKFTVNAARSGTIIFGLGDTDGSFTVTDSGGLYLWGAQLEQRDSLTAYTPTTDQPITNYIPALQTAQNNQARFDHDPVTEESLGLLIEEQRTNLFTYSEDFSDSYWTKDNCSITANTIVAPDGTLTGDKLVEDASNAGHTVVKTITGLSSVYYTHSVFVKAGERTYISLNGSAAFNYFAVFDLSTQEVVSGNYDNAGITHVGNGWYRCHITGEADTTTQGFSSLLIRVLLNATPPSSYQGDGFSGVYIWGAQFEQGSFPTSYIPTSGSTATRSSDRVVLTGTALTEVFNPSQGTMYVNYNAPILGGRTTDPYVVAFSGGIGSTSPPSMRIRLEDSNNSAAFQIVLLSGTVSANIAGGIPSDLTDAKVCATYAVDDFAISVGGASAVTDTSGPLNLSSVSHLILGHNNGSLNGTIRKFAYYPQRLTNEELQRLTEA